MTSWVAGSPSRSEEEPLEADAGANEAAAAEGVFHAQIGGETEDDGAAVEGGGGDLAGVEDVEVAGLGAYGEARAEGDAAGGAQVDEAVGHVGDADGAGAAV